VEGIGNTSGAGKLIGDGKKAWVSTGFSQSASWKLFEGGIRDLRIMRKVKITF
jgi:hypothetical protein